MKIFYKQLEYCGDWMSVESREFDATEDGEFLIICDNSKIVRLNKICIDFPVVSLIDKNNIKVGSFSYQKIEVIQLIEHLEREINIATQITLQNVKRMHELQERDNQGNGSIRTETAE